MARSVRCYNLLAENQPVGGSDVVQIDFWYSIGSTYSYLTVMRLSEIEKQSGIEFRWRPFNVRHVMVEQNNIPFKGKPVKTAYMWRDIERRANQYGLAPSIPAPYPLLGLLLANQVATLGVEEGWVKEYTRATYRRWFEDGKPAGEEPNISASLEEIGCDSTQVLAAAQSERIINVLSSATDEAMELGVFGSPTFVVDGEIFWGDDRLKDAVVWAEGNRPH
jgi:2-hydroxychromene-2-carboxylate isomerase